MFRPDGHVHPTFLLYLLSSPELVAFANQVAEGIARPRVPWRGLMRFEAPLPPAAEQGRIVKAIEEQFSRLDAAEELVKAAGRRLMGLRAKTLALLLETPGPHTTIGDVATVGSGATPMRGEARYWDGGTIPWVASGQLGGSFVHQPSGYITDEALRETSVKVWPSGTLLVALYGEGKTRGKCSELAIDATTNQACAAIVVRDELVSTAYLKLFLNASYSKNRERSSGGVQPNLNLGLIRAIRFPVPPRNEQRRIVAEVEQRLSVIDAMRAAIESAQRRSAALRRSILERAFRGELVPQDPTDEPASILLERIRAERVAQPTARARRTMKRATASRDAYSSADH